MSSSSQNTFTCMYLVTTRTPVGVVCTCIHEHTGQINMPMSTHKYTYCHTHVHMYIRTYARTHMYARTHTHTHTCTHTQHTETNTETNTCRQTHTTQTDKYTHNIHIATVMITWLHPMNLLCM